MHKREYNSERRRKHIKSFIDNPLLPYIRENITPRGDGNLFWSKSIRYICNTSIIRENITPRGDGNLKKDVLYPAISFSIRENITPRGDGNVFKFSFTIAFATGIRENITPRGDGNGQWIAASVN